MSRKRLNTGIYCFENKVNGKRYIGQAYNVERRLYEHEYYLSRGRDKCAALQRAVSKYGKESFDVFIIESCEPNMLNEREVYYISEYKTNNRNFGYNISAGGDSGLIGHKPPPEVGRKISAAKKGWKMSEEQKIKISNWHTGKYVSPETRERISAGLSGENHYMFGKKHTEESIQKMRAAHGKENAYQFGKKSPNASSKYFGVGKIVSKSHVYWSVNIKVGGERFHVGASKIEEEAARLYDAYVIENGLPNPLNFTQEQID